MVQDSIAKIKQAEAEAEKIVIEATKEVKDSAIQEKGKWEKELEKIREQSVTDLDEKLVKAQAEAGSLRQDRASATAGKVKKLTSEAQSEVAKAVDFVAEGVLKSV